MIYYRIERFSLPKSAVTTRLPLMIYYRIERRSAKKKLKYLENLDDLL